jgi:DNA-binding response OmpR family regulator
MNRPLRILAVDNEPSVTTALSFAFPAPQYQIVTVSGGAEALAELDTRSEPFDVVIVDQKMPHITGAQLVAAMRERTIRSSVIVLSAQITPDVRSTYSALHVEAIFEKPFDLTQLRAAVNGCAARPECNTPAPVF